MGKYTQLKGKLPAFEQPPAWQQKVEASKASYIGLDVAGLARELKLFKLQKDNAEQNISEFNIEIEAVSQILLSELSAQQLQSFKLETGETISIRDEPYVSIEDKAACRKWQVREKLTPLMSAPWQTINALIKERLIEGRPIPKWAKVFLKSTVRLTGARELEKEVVDKH
jgi:hypothetical protein